MGILGRKEQDGERFHHTTRNGARFVIQELFVSGIFRLVLSDCALPQVTSTAQGETVDAWQQLYV